VERPLRIQAFAALTSVTVRALHHYDRIGLLRPQRSGSGYRLYGNRELERLEQIVALRFIGVPLKQMRPLLEGSVLAEALPRQRAMLEEKRRNLDEAIGAIRAAESSLADGRQPDTVLLKKIIEVIEMQNDSKWTEKYYSPAAQAAIEARQATVSPEYLAKKEQEWRDLFRDVEAAIDQDPASPTAQQLGRRWKALIAKFTGGNTEVTEGLGRLWADGANWPVAAQQQMAAFTNRKVWEFMGRVLKCQHPA